MKRKSRDIISNMYISIAIVMILAQLTTFLASLIDGIITSRFLGTGAYSAISLLNPLVSILVMFSGLLSAGCQILCARHLSHGEKEKADLVFTISVITGLLISFLFMFVCLTFPDFMFSISGVKSSKNPEIYPFMNPYLRGYLIGAPAVILIQILSPILVLDNHKRLITVSTIVLCVSDVIGDLLNALVFHQGNFGMGVATSIAYILECLVLLSHFVSKKCHFRFTLSGFRFSFLSEILKGGSPDIVRRFANILRDLLVNRMNLLVSVSAAAVAARGIQSDLNTILFAFGMGLGRALLPMSSLYYGAEDKDGLKRVFSCAVRLSIGISLVVGALMFVFAHPIISIYSKDAEVVSLAVFSIRCMSIALVFDTLATVMQNYLQGIKNMKMVSFLCIGERFFIPVIASIILGLLFGSKGILASIAAGKVLLVFIMMIIILIRCKGFPKSLLDYMFLPSDFGGADSDNLLLTVSSFDDLSSVFDEIHSFAAMHKLSPQTSYHLSLVSEEMVKNVLQHGSCKKGLVPSIEIRIYISTEHILITLRDDCLPFDPTAFYSSHSKSSIEDGIGIPAVMHISKEVKYIHAFNMNNVLIYL